MPLDPLDLASLCLFDVMEVELAGRNRTIVFMGEAHINTRKNMALARNVIKLFPFRGVEGVCDSDLQSFSSGFKKIASFVTFLSKSASHFGLESSTIYEASLNGFLFSCDGIIAINGIAFGDLFPPGYSGTVPKNPSGALLENLRVYRSLGHSFEIKGAEEERPNRILASSRPGADTALNVLLRNNALADLPVTIGLEYGALTTWTEKCTAPTRGDCPSPIHRMSLMEVLTKHPSECNLDHCDLNHIIEVHRNERMTTNLKNIFEAFPERDVILVMTGMLHVRPIQGLLPDPVLLRHGHGFKVESEYRKRNRLKK